MTPSIRVGSFETKMRFRFKHASADRSETDNVIVELRDSDGVRGYGEGCPREYVTNETRESAWAFLFEYGSAIAEAASDLGSLNAWLHDNEGLIDQNPAAFCAIECAALDWMGKRQSKSLEALLGLPPLNQPVRYTAVLGDSSPAATLAMSFAYRAWGLDDYKVKLSGDLRRDKKRFRVLPKNVRIRVDANNFWKHEPADCIAHISELDRPVWAIEEPVGAGDIQAMRMISDALGAKIVLDESLSRREEIDAYAEDASRWLANIRVSKCGGIIRSIEAANQAHEAGLGVILGAHVAETSLLTRAALTVGQALSKDPYAREGAYGRLLLQNDVTAPSLRFRKGGVLQFNEFDPSSKDGNGLDVLVDTVQWR